MDPVTIVCAVCLTVAFALLVRDHYSIILFIREHEIYLQELEARRY